MSTSQTTKDPKLVDLDCTDLLCPLPVYKTALVLNKAEPGQRIRLTTTDLGALEDIPAMVRQRGDRLIETTKDSSTQVFIIEKGTHS